MKEELKKKYLKQMRNKRELYSSLISLKSDKNKCSKKSTVDVRQSLFVLSPDDLAKIGEENENSYVESASNLSHQFDSHETSNSEIQLVKDKKEIEMINDDGQKVKVLMYADFSDDDSIEIVCILY